MNEKFWNKHDTFPWGKHKGDILLSVIIHDVGYVTWCIEHIEGFILDNETYKLYETFLDQP